MSCAMRSLAWPLVFALVSGCERPAEELPPRSAATESAAPPPSVAEVVPAGPPPAPARCIHPLAPEPVRPAPPAGPDPKCPDDPGRPTLSWGKVRFPEIDATVEVEVARDDDHRQRGLMFRRELPDDQGMIFVFERPRIQTFWMKNTCLPLDMIFIAGDGLVVGIEENVPTMNTKTYSVPCPSIYVLEVNAGWARRHGVQAGQRVLLEGIAE
jgi:uncharacterized protein